MCAMSWLDIYSPSPGGLGFPRIVTFRARDA
jgi:hypothetical protein